jgi:uncharacterized small protein (DUF1192 family)
MAMQRGIPAFGAGSPVLPGSGAKSMAAKDISPSELSQRVAVIKRFKELLKAQRDRFQAYLTALDKQKDVIQMGTTDELLRYVELEENIVKDIFSIQKVIEPLEHMYQSTQPARPAEKESGEVTSLKEALEGLKAEAVVRSERNRELLSKRMADLRSEIKTLKSSYNLRRPANSSTPSLVDIKG